MWFLWSFSAREFKEVLQSNAAERVLVDHLTLVMYKCRYLIYHALLFRVHGLLENHM